MKICSKCNLSTNKFPRAGTKCQPCVNQGGYESKKRKFADIRQYIQDRKSNPCADCGNVYPTYVMDFDHLPQYEKSFNLARFQSMNKSMRQVVDEIKKCDLVCANCHRIRTFSRVEKISMIECI